MVVARRSFFNGLVILVVLLIVLLAVERQIAGFVVSEARARFSTPGGTTPTDILASATNANGTTALLAVGDIANCKVRPGLTDSLPNTAHLLGLPSPYDTTGALAHQTATLASDWPELPILALGDLVYSKGSPFEFAWCFEPTWGALKPRILPTPGNHEYKTPGAFGYFDYFGSQAGPNRQGWYAASVPGWLILSLNSEVDAQAGSEQAAWLDEQFEGAGSECVLAFYHKPAYSLVERGGRENAINLFRQLQKNGATLVLNGHNHFYERTAPLDGTGALAKNMGTVAFTVGTGGKTKSAKPSIKETKAAVFGRTGILRIDLGSDEYSWTYIDAITRDVLDEGTAPCNSMRG